MLYLATVPLDYKMLFQRAKLLLTIHLNAIIRTLKLGNPKVVAYIYILYIFYLANFLKTKLTTFQVV